LLVPVDVVSTGKVTEAVRDGFVISLSVVFEAAIAFQPIKKRWTGLRCEAYVQCHSCHRQS